MREVRPAGLDPLALATVLVRRARGADAVARPCEAADVRWWSRKPRRSDGVEQRLWIDDDGPAAGMLLTSWTGDEWTATP